MRDQRGHTRLIGATFWLVVVGLFLAWVLTGETDRATAMMNAVWTYEHEAVIEDPTRILREGDNLFGLDEDQQWKSFGYITRVRPNTGTSSTSNQVSVTLIRDVDLRKMDLRVHRSSGRLEDVLATLLPKMKREQLVERLESAFEIHGQAVSNALLPLVSESLRQSVPVLESSLASAIEDHRAQIEMLADRYREDVLRDRVVPLMKQEVLPIIREHGEPPAEEIGQEIWERASLWRFGWRALYDKSPLPERDLLKEEWRRFLDTEVIPIVESHLDEVALAVESMLRDIVANEKLRGELSEVVSEIARDPAAQQLLRSIVEQAVIKNEELRETWRSVWTSPDTERRLRDVGKRMEPILREIGDEVLGTRETGIEPGFARVLRNQILSKDRSWVTLIPNESIRPEDTVRLKARYSAEFMPYPVIHLASPSD